MGRRGKRPGVAPFHSLGLTVSCDRTEKLTQRNRGNSENDKIVASSSEESKKKEKWDWIHASATLLIFRNEE